MGAGIWGKDLLLAGTVKGGEEGVNQKKVFGHRGVHKLKICEGKGEEVFLRKYRDGTLSTGKTSIVTKQNLFF